MRHIYWAGGMLRMDLDAATYADALKVGTLEVALNADVKPATVAAK